MVEARARGILMVTAAAALWSTAGVFVRLLPQDLWTMLAWRSLFAALALGIVVAWRYRLDHQRLAAGLGRPALLAVPLAAVSMASYVAALQLTSVANVMVIYATVPLLAAAVALVWFGERMSRRAALASVAALGGVVLLVGAAARPQDLAGNGLAFLMTATFAVQLVMARRFQSLDMAPVNALAALLCALAAWPLAASTVPPPTELAILALFGATTTGLAYALYLAGGRYLPAGEAGLLGMIDVVLGPLWVWLAFDEQPGPAALTGGAIVTLAVLWYLTPRRAGAPPG